MSKQTFETHLGSVTAETCKCANCGNEVLTKDAVSVGFGLGKTSCGGFNCDHTHDKVRTTRQLCSHCADTLFSYSRANEYVDKVSTFAAAVVCSIIAFVMGASAVMFPLAFYIVVTVTLIIAFCVCLWAMTL